MPKKKVFMLRLDPVLYATLEKWAADEFRSVNGQIEWLLDRTLKDRGRSVRAGSKPVADVSLPSSRLAPEIKQPTRDVDQKE